MCGDYRIIRPSPKLTHGSPPRVRGLRTAQQTMESSSRITPACAGTTHIIDVCQHSLKDHPRVCGDYFDEVLMQI